MRKNIKGIQFERWNHSNGCRRWFNVTRNTATDEILKIYNMGEQPPIVTGIAPKNSIWRNLYRFWKYFNFIHKKIIMNKKISFTFDGKKYSGFEGDTLASALIRNGVFLVGRSFKYHRPRGMISAGSEEPNAIIQLESGEITEPNVRATEIKFMKD